MWKIPSNLKPLGCTAMCAIFCGIKLANLDGLFQPNEIINPYLFISQPMIALQFKLQLGERWTVKDHQHKCPKSVCPSKGPDPSKTEKKSVYQLKARMSFVYGTLITSLRLNQNLVKQSNFKPNCGSLPYVCACGGRNAKNSWQR